MVQKVNGSGQPEATMAGVPCSLNAHLAVIGDIVTGLEG